MAKAKSHCGFRNEKLFCFNCGGSHEIHLPLPVKQMTDTMKAFEKLHRNCLPTWKEPEAPASEGEPRNAAWWLANGEHGLSSKTIYSVITGQNIMGTRYGYAHPCDPDDFRRCYLLLKAVPEWRIKLDRMRSISPVWNSLVDNWDKLTEMLEVAMKSKTGKAPEMYDLMKSIGC